MSSSNERVAVLSDNTALSTGINKAEDSWNTLTQVTNYVSSIKLSELSLDSPALYSIITAIPSPWVRAHVTKNAISNKFITAHDKELGKFEGLSSLYSAIQDEYKGVIACLCLYNSKIRVEKVDLRYPDAHNFKDADKSTVLKGVRNIYDLPGAFGNMLFEEANIWMPTNVNKLKDDARPFVLLISIDDVVIAGTSPQTLLYPAAGYDFEDSFIPFFMKGRFKNPVDYLERKDLIKLLHYVRKIKDQLNSYKDEFDQPEQDMTLPIFSFFREFEQEIEEKIIVVDSTYNLKSHGVVEFCDKFKDYHPFTKIFDIDFKIYKTPDGRYLIDNETGDLPEFNPSKLLLSDETTRILKLDGGTDFSKTSILKAYDSNGNDHYFTLPLSGIGIHEFQNQIRDVLGLGSKGILHDKLLTAKYSPESESLEVTLRLEISGSETHFSKIYKVSNASTPLNPGVQIWPNFISSDWKSYFCFSNIPHTGKGIKAMPLIAQEDAIEKIRFGTDKNLYHFNLDRDQRHTSCILKHDPLLQKEKVVRYEVYQSQYPFLGIEMSINSNQLNDHHGGYILLNTVDATKVINNSGKADYEQVVVSIDFGSTNTSVSYVDRSQSIHNLNLLPKKLELFNTMLPDSDQLNLGDVFFFHDREQRTPFKSALLQHNTERLADADLQKSQPISGGISLQKSDLPIMEGDKSSLKLVVGDETADIIYDLKWKRQDRFLVNKKAFLKNVWLLTCAELFQSAKRPTQLVWSYPSSMPRDLVRTYEGMFEEVVADVIPIRTNGILPINVKTAKVDGNNNSFDKAITESEAICNYALTRGNVSISRNNVFIGVDIGGITSDILVVSNDNGASRALILKQSSVKIAGDRLANVIGQSSSIKACLRHFIKKHNISIPGFEKYNSTTSGYFTNLIFDYLESNRALEEAFYNTIWAPDDEELNRDETRGLIAIPAYICGLLLFHAGQLLASVLESDDSESSGIFNLEEPLTVTLSSYGKGGKLFDWLPTAFGNDTAKIYYESAFIEGLMASEKVKHHGTKILFSYRKGPEKDLKREVSVGLVSQRGVVQIHPKSSHDLIGEKGYHYDGQKSLNWNSEIQPYQIFEIGEKFTLPSKKSSENSITGLERFDAFLTIFLNLVREEGIIDHTVISEQSKEFLRDHLENYVKTDEDWLANASRYQRTLEDEDFKFSGSPFLFQGACYLDRIIIPNIYRH
jgi:hypothetical protein